MNSPTRVQLLRERWGLIRSRTALILAKAESGDTLSRCFDVFLVSLIFINIVAVVLESVQEYRARWSHIFSVLEFVSVIIFSLEYLCRVWSITENPSHEKYRHPVKGRLRYIFSPIAIIDLMAVAPFWLSMFIPLDLRFLRVVRLLRVLKLTRYSASMNLLFDVVREEAGVISAGVFLLFIFLVLAASSVYYVEHTVQPEAFANIPQAMWWGIVTVTTVGYGDVVPITPIGKIIGSILGLIGVAMVALPAGIMAAGFSSAVQRRRQSFESSGKSALADGVIDDAEDVRLRDHGSSLSLSEKDISNIISDNVLDRGEQADVCPHCHRPYR